MLEDLGFYQLDGNDEELRILQITDLHQWPKGENKFQVSSDQVIELDKAGYKPDENTILTEKLIASVKPHFAILTGDIIDGRPQEHRDPDAWIETFLDVVQPLIDHKIPWSFVPGNHDCQPGVSPYPRNDLMKVFDLPMCLSKGASSFNHTIRIGFIETKATRIWLLDSGENHPDPKIRYTTFESSVVSGFIERSKSISEEEKSLMFFHIPLPEHGGKAPLVGQNNLFDACLQSGKIPSPWKYVPGVVRVLGKQYIVGSSTINSGLFDAIVENSNVVAAFCGHDHTSDCVVERKGVYLCYGRCGSQTPPSDWEGKIEFPFPRGARVVKVNFQHSTIETYIQVEGGKEPGSRLVFNTTKRQ